MLTAGSSVSAAQRYLGTFGECGTGRQAATFQLTVLTPMLFSLPAAGWFLASRVGLGVLPCRCATWASVAAWATAFACTNL